MSFYVTQACATEIESGQMWVPRAMLYGRGMGRSKPLACAVVHVLCAAV